MHLLILICFFITSGAGLSPMVRTIQRSSHSSLVAIHSSSQANFDKSQSVQGSGVVDPNVYNVPVETAAELWTVSVSPDTKAGREAGIPFLDSKSKDYFVDDVRVVISRVGGMGLNLLELAGGRADTFGITIVSEVTGNAVTAGVLPGDSIASIQIRTKTVEGTNVQETQETLDCECRDFDTTIGLLTSIPSEINAVVLNLKRIRRWAKVQVVVEYPPSQCAQGVDNKVYLELFAGENLRRALQNRGIVMEDGTARKCDFCGGKCTVKVDMGMPLLSPMSTTEDKIMKNNPKCRLSCKAVIGYGMQEGNMRLKVNLNAWNEDDRKSSSPFFSG
ncbi:hypothetical protein MHU86_302 [Fragilaria crotonensis]|nr:hypothetical protein MHU86_302 [Fragilaria crotonensis]